MIITHKTLAIGLFLVGGITASSGQSSGDLRTAASEAVALLGKTIPQAQWRTHITTASFTYLKADRILVGFHKSDGSLASITDQGFRSSRLKGAGPSQARKFVSNAQWESHLRVTAQKFMPGSVLERPAITIRGSQRSSIGVWGSSSNTAAVQWRTKPVGGYYRIVSMNVDLASGQWIDVSRSPRFQVRP